MQKHTKAGKTNKRYDEQLADTNDRSFFKRIRNRKLARNSRRQIIIRVVREDSENKGITENTSGRFTAEMVTVRDAGEPL